MVVNEHWVVFYIKANDTPIMMTDDELTKRELARLKNAYALSGLLPQEGDKERTRQGLKELNERIVQRSHRRLRLNIMKYAAVICLLVVGTWFITYLYVSDDSETLFTEINVPKGQRVNIVLADGTSVWLSPRSKIKVPNEFKQANRVVELDGEGFFEVTKNVEHPFIVKTGKYNVKVLGTRFNVFAYSEKSRFETCLVEGSVLVYNRDNEKDGLYLKPNEKVSLENNRLVKSVSDFNNEKYLESGVFSFQSKPFIEILEYLSLWYGVQFEVERSVAIYRKISGKFRQSDEVDNILRALQGAHSFNFKRLDNDKIQIF